MSTQLTNSSSDYDVVVVGAGMAGYAAAIAASECGASVLLLEKMREYGGGTAWSGGAFCSSMGGLGFHIWISVRTMAGCTWWRA